MYFEHAGAHGRDVVSVLEYWADYCLSTYGLNCHVINFIVVQVPAWESHDCF